MASSVGSPASSRQFESAGILRSTTRPGTGRKRGYGFNFAANFARSLASLGGMTALQYD